MNKKSTILLGSKLYKSNNTSEQGPGSANSDANFNYYYNKYPLYGNQSAYNYPNLNISIFGENIFYVDSNVSITPGFRFEHIDTKSDGYYRNIRVNLAQDPIFLSLIHI